MSLPSLSVALAGVVLATLVGRATGAGWLPAIGLASLLGIGLYLWARDENKGWGDLGQGIIVSVIVAIGLMAVQRDADERTREASEHRDRELRQAEEARQKVAEWQALQLSLTMGPDLRGITLADRDMHRFFLADKDFSSANLRGANLEHADLRFSKMRNAVLAGAKLDQATMIGADLQNARLSTDFATLDAATPPNLPRTSLRGTVLESADLRNADLGGADLTSAVLIEADLRGASAGYSISGTPTSFRDAILIGADLRGALMYKADLRGSKLGVAQFCGVHGLRTANLRGAIYDDATRWPRGFDPKSRGAQRVHGRQARSHEDGPVGTVVVPPPRVPPCER